MSRRLGAIAIAFPLLALAGCAAETPPAEAPESTGIDFAEVTAVLEGRMQLGEGERVLLVATPGRFDPLLDLLASSIEQAGADYLGTASTTSEAFPGPHATDFVAGLDRASEAELGALVADVDLGIMLPGATPEEPVYAALQDLLRRDEGRTIHFHWAGSYGFDGVLFEPTSLVDSAYVHSLTQTDYAALGASQRAFEEAMRDSEVRVTTPAGTDITFRIGDRPVTKQDGDASAAGMTDSRNLIDREVELPAGAIRVAPIEESVEGRIVFPPSVWNGTLANGVTLTFEAGQAVSIQADQGLEAVEAELDAAGDAGRAFREFALGFNPTLTIPSSDPWIPYYGYGAGVVRLSLGDNTELGGAVGGGYVRWNFFVDATVMVDGETWVEHGRLIR